MELACVLSRETPRELLQIHDWAAEVAELVDDNVFNLNAESPENIECYESGLPGNGGHGNVIRIVEFTQLVELEHKAEVTLTNFEMFNAKKAMGGSDAPIAEDTVALEHT